MDFELTSAQKDLCRDILALGRRLSGAPPEPSGAFPHEAWRACAEFGIQGLPFSRALGGRGHDPMTTVIALEALGSAVRDNGLLFALSAQMASVQMPIARFGSDRQRETYLRDLCSGKVIGAHAMTEPGSGSDAFSLATRADRQGEVYVLNGEKSFVSEAPVADLYLVFATVRAQASVLGITAFLVERGTPGLRVGPPIQKTGLESAPMAMLFLEDVPVPASQRLGREGRGASLFADAMEWERIMIMATGVGALARQLEDARTSHRRPGPDYAVLADMKVRLELARLILYRATWAKERGEQAAAFSSMAKLVIGEAMLRGALEAMQLEGVPACARTNTTARDLCDFVAAPIYSGTSDMQRRVIARSLGLHDD